MTNRRSFVLPAAVVAAVDDDCSSCSIVAEAAEVMEGIPCLLVSLNETFSRE